MAYTRIMLQINPPEFQVWLSEWWKGKCITILCPYVYKKHLDAALSPV